MNKGFYKEHGSESMEQMLCISKEKDQWLVRYGMVKTDGMAIADSKEYDHKPSVAEVVADVSVLVEEYYNSSAVSSFTYQGVSMWTDFEHRQKLRMRLEAEEASGLTQTVIWYAGHRFELPISVTEQLLSQVELYASKAYDCYQGHLSALSGLDSVEAVLGYDWRQGWPSKLEF